MVTDWRCILPLLYRGMYTLLSVSISFQSLELLAKLWLCRFSSIRINAFGSIICSNFNETSILSLCSQLQLCLILLRKTFLMTSTQNLQNLHLKLEWQFHWAHLFMSLLLVLCSAIVYHASYHKVILLFYFPFFFTPLLNHRLQEGTA